MTIEIGTLEEIAHLSDRVREAESELASARSMRDAMIRQGLAEGGTVRRLSQASGLHYSYISRLRGKEDPR